MKKEFYHWLEDAGCYPSLKGMALVIIYDVAEDRDHICYLKLAKVSD